MLKPDSPSTFVTTRAKVSPLSQLSSPLPETDSFHTETGAKRGS